MTNSQITQLPTDRSADSDSSLSTPTITSTRTKFRNSLVSLVKAPTRSRLLSLSKPRKSASSRSSKRALSTTLLPSERTSQSIDSVSDSYSLESQPIMTTTSDLDRNPLSQPVAPLPSPPSTDQDLETLLSTPNAHQVPQARTASSRSSIAISEFDAEAGVHQYAELAKLSFSAWARRRESSHGSSASGSPNLPRYQSEQDDLTEAISLPPSPDSIKPHSSLNTTSTPASIITHPSPTLDHAALEENEITVTPVGSRFSSNSLQAFELTPASDLGTGATVDCSIDPLSLPKSESSPHARTIPVEIMMSGADPFLPVFQLPTGSQETISRPDPDHLPNQNMSAYLVPDNPNQTHHETTGRGQEDDQGGQIPKETGGGCSENGSDSQHEPSEVTPPLPSLSLSLFHHLFDPRLSWTRKLACVSATLAINLFLPFVNGIMLGFGEIAAREFVGRYFGWGRSTPLIVGGGQRRKQDQAQLEETLPRDGRSRWWEPTQQGVMHRT